MAARIITGRQILNRIFTIKPKTSRSGPIGFRVVAARAAPTVICSGTAGEESEPVGPGVEARLGRTETSCAPDWTAHAGFSFDEPGAWMVEDAACDC